jgi:hypothetical protein
LLLTGRPQPAKEKPMPQPNQGNPPSGDRDMPREQKEGSQNPGGQQGDRENQKSDTERNRDRNQGGSQGNNPSQGSNQRENRQQTIEFHFTSPWNFRFALTCVLALRSALPSAIFRNKFGICGDVRTSAL